MKKLLQYVVPSLQCIMVNGKDKVHLSCTGGSQPSGAVETTSSTIYCSDGGSPDSSDCRHGNNVTWLCVAGNTTGNGCWNGDSNSDAMSYASGRSCANGPIIATSLSLGNCSMGASPT